MRDHRERITGVAVVIALDRMERMSELQLVCFRLKTTLDRLAGLRSADNLRPDATDGDADRPAFAPAPCRRRG